MILSILAKQKKFFRTHATRDVKFRLKYLRRLKATIKKYEGDILQALQKDLGKPAFEGYATEVGFVLNNISHIRRNLLEWVKDKKVKTPLHQQPHSKSFIKSVPYGTVLIIGPFNYPFQLLMEPLIGALAAGNTAILKPSEYTWHTEKIIQRIISETFNEEYVTLFSGGKQVVTTLLEQPFDLIFFTGSVAVGKIVMQAAAKHLTPVILELGGKSPVIVDQHANIQVAARRITWGKFINTGQTCVAPDYAYVHKNVEASFKEALQKTVLDFYGENPQKSKDYGRIINHRQFDRLVQLIDSRKVFVGGQWDRDELYIAPTLMTHVTWEDPVMANEIFGPILPIMVYEQLEHVIETINDKPNPLAFYVFSEDEAIQQRAINEIAFGGGAINDTVSHVASPYLPFGGVGSSGMGEYHGEYSFMAFSHRKSIISKSTMVDIKLIYPPYHNRDKLLKHILK